MTGLPTLAPDAIVIGDRGPDEWRCTWASFCDANEETIGADELAEIAAVVASGVRYVMPGGGGAGWTLELASLALPLRTTNLVVAAVRLREERIRTVNAIAAVQRVLFESPPCAGAARRRDR